MNRSLQKFLLNNNFTILKRSVFYEGVVINNFFLSDEALFAKHIQSQTFNNKLPKEKRVIYSKIFNLYSQQ